MTDTTFGDFDPEDAYDPDDTILERLVNIDARLRWFTEEGHGPLQDDALADRMARARDDLRLIGRELLLAIVALDIDVDRAPTLPPVVFPPGRDR